MMVGSLRMDGGKEECFMVRIGEDAGGGLGRGRA